MIAVFIDGTRNHAAPRETDGRTHVRRLFEEMRPMPQAALLYLPGVGCEAVAEMDTHSASEPGLVNAVEALLRTSAWQANALFRGLLGAGCGAGLTARVLAAYAFICAARRQHPQAQLSIVGFSRGAYACCVLAHFMARAGMVVATDQFGLLHDEVRQVWTYDNRQLAANIQSGQSNAWQLPAQAEAVRVDFLGCWDTVCAVGVPEQGYNVDVIPAPLGRLVDGLLQWVHGLVEVTQPRFIQVFVPPNVVNARHALALHEYRVAFNALPWSPPALGTPLPLPAITQTWFPGAHADVGGGYPETDDSAPLSQQALQWMKHAMWPSRWGHNGHDALDWPIHDSSTGLFKATGPKIRRALTHLTVEQLQTMTLSDGLAQGLLAGTTPRLCGDGAAWGRPGEFKPKIADLHADARAKALQLRLRSSLARAAAQHAQGTVPVACANPTDEEAQTADQDRLSHIQGELTAEGLAAMAHDPFRIRRLARCCGHHLVLTGQAAGLTAIARHALDRTLGTAGKASALRVLNRVLLAPLAFAQGHRARWRIRFGLHQCARVDGSSLPAGKVIKL